jgi:hypothetical protein
LGLLNADLVDECFCHVCCSGESGTSSDACNMPFE